MGTAVVLVVAADRRVRELLTTSLRHSGFDVRATGDVGAAARIARECPPNAAVLDIAPPESAGVELARWLRAEHPGVGVLFLTTHRIAGLTAGGDDAVAKPFSVEDVVLRLQGVLHQTRELGYADLVLDEDSREVRRAGRVIPLSPTEFTLLRYLMVNAEQVVTRSQILDRVWSYAYDGDSRIVESYISYLRRKIDRSGPPLIRTVRGAGYTLRDNEVRSGR